MPASGNGQALPILVAGGGIGGLAAAHALARKGFPVRVLEQAPEFREIGAGIPLEDPRFAAAFEQPYAVTHRHDLHSVFVDACKRNNLIALETQRTVEDFEQDDDGVSAVLHSGERIRGRALIGCDGMWSKVRDNIVGDGKPRVSGHIAYRAVLRREEVPQDLWQPDVI